MAVKLPRGDDPAPEPNHEYDGRGDHDESDAVVPAGFTPSAEQVSEVEAANRERG